MTHRHLELNWPIPSEAERERERNLCFLNLILTSPSISPSFTHRAQLEAVSRETTKTADSTSVNTASKTDDIIRIKQLEDQLERTRDQLVQTEDQLERTRDRCGGLEQQVTQLKHSLHVSDQQSSRGLVGEGEGKEREREVGEEVREKEREVEELRGQLLAAQVSQHQCLANPYMGRQLFPLYP